MNHLSMNFSKPAFARAALNHKPIQNWSKLFDLVLLDRRIKQKLRELCDPSLDSKFELEIYDKATLLTRYLSNELSNLLGYSIPIVLHLHDSNDPTVIHGFEMLHGFEKPATQLDPNHRGVAITLLLCTHRAFINQTPGVIPGTDWNITAMGATLTCLGLDMVPALE